MKYTSQELLNAFELTRLPAWKVLISFIDERRDTNGLGSKASLVGLIDLFSRERMLGAEETLTTLVIDFEQFTKEGYKQAVEEEAKDHVS